MLRRNIDMMSYYKNVGFMMLNSHIGAYILEYLHTSPDLIDAYNYIRTNR